MLKKIKDKAKNKYSKSKNVWVAIIAIFIVITLFQTYQSNTNISGDTLQKIQENTEISLNSFLSQYKNNNFSKIDVINDSKLIWYTFLWTWEWKDFMLIQKTIIEER